MAKILVQDKDCPCVIVFQNDTIMEHIRCADGKNAEDQFIETLEYYGGKPDSIEKTNDMLEEGRAIIPNGFVFLSWAM